MNGGKVCREALTKVSFGFFDNVGDSDAKGRALCASSRYTHMTSTVERRAVHQIIDSA